MTDVVSLTDFREEVRIKEFMDMFEELTGEFSDRAVAYLATQHPELWKDASVRGAALTIVTGFMCRDAYGMFLQIAKLQTNSPEEFRRLCRELRPEKKPKS